MGEVDPSGLPCGQLSRQLVVGLAQQSSQPSWLWGYQPVSIALGMALGEVHTRLAWLPAGSPGGASPRNRPARGPGRHESGGAEWVLLGVPPGALPEGPGNQCCGLATWLSR